MNKWASGLNFWTSYPDTRIGNFLGVWMASTIRYTSLQGGVFEKAGPNFPKASTNTTRRSRVLFGLARGKFGSKNNETSLVIFAGQNSEIFGLIELFWLPAFSGNPTLQRGVSNLHRDQYISHQFCEILIKEQRGVWKSRGVFGRAERCLEVSREVFGQTPLCSIPNTSLLQCLEDFL